MTAVTENAPLNAFLGGDHYARDIAEDLGGGNAVIKQVGFATPVKWTLPPLGLQDGRSVPIATNLCVFLIRPSSSFCIFEQEIIGHIRPPSSRSLLRQKMVPTKCAQNWINQLALCCRLIRIA